MSVIGRLDGQVEEVIINPVGRRRADEDGGARPTQPAPPAETTRESREQQRDERDAAAELPVWLL